ncbi:hypothetical protein PsorP6_003376 [Peronosclerospora sorghi]|uniref:Uncharacterized protein n=1 Tax=Peronosclerospora sorghi TaxID=230839 RepID=A0ACC0VL59_9STRA|nr:hypothetical protein PsorP6_003376 [Peronosclerospora sorghi]
MHEYEQHVVCVNNTLLGLTLENTIIAKLFEENKQEKLKNGMLKECLREQKHAKEKVMKACNHVKQKLQDLRDSGLRQMRLYMEARCNILKKGNIRLANEHLSQRSLPHMCFQLSQEYPFNSNQAELVYEAMSRYETSTNVRFVTTATCEKEGMSFCDSCKNWVDFKHPTSGHDCNSSIGILEGGAQIMNLADRCFEVDDDLKTVYGTAMHEIGHSL